MNKVFNFLSLTSFSLLVSLTSFKGIEPKGFLAVDNLLLNTAGSATNLVAEKARIIFDSLDLDQLGLTPVAFTYAYKGYTELLEKGKIKKSGLLTICDFSQSSRNKRLYLVDMENMKVLKNTWVAHGRNSGAEFAKTFSNTPRSHKSSLGFYITSSTYNGGHGLSLRLMGVEKGINDKAYQRHIVIHGSKYAGEDFLEANPFLGRSFGCPAVPSEDNEELIETIKDGSCLFIYHPSATYIRNSKILNG